MTRDEAVATAEKAYPKEFLDFGCGRSDNRAACELLVDRLAFLGVITLSDAPVAPPLQVDSGREDNLCQCPKCGRMHRGLGAGKPPAIISGEPT